MPAWNLPRAENSLSHLRFLPLFFQSLARAPDQGWWGCAPLGLPPPSPGDSSRGCGRPTYPATEPPPAGADPNSPRLGSGAGSIRPQLRPPPGRTRQQRLWDSSALVAPALRAAPGGTAAGRKEARPRGFRTPGGKRRQAGAVLRGEQAVLPGSLLAVRERPAAAADSERRPRRPGSLLPPPPLLPHPTQLPPLRPSNLGNVGEVGAALAARRASGGSKGGEEELRWGGRLAPAPGELRSAGPFRGSLFPVLRLSPPLPWDSLNDAGIPTRSQRGWEELPSWVGGGGGPGVPRGLTLPEPLKPFRPPSY